jgi:hypothetical protein
MTTFFHQAEILPNATLKQDPAAATATAATARLPWLIKLEHDSLPADLEQLDRLLRDSQLPLSIRLEKVSLEDAEWLEEQLHRRSLRPR